MDSPADVKGLNENQARQLCAELRDFLVREVSRTGGHLASNLGVVELTVAIHRVFDTSVDRLVFDVGHQCYVHKILTGRREQMDTLRQFGGLSGFPKPFHSMAAHKEKGAKAAIRLLQNANQVSSVCNDVVGDICGIVSGSTAAVIVTHLQRDLSTTSVLISIGATALISGITIGGKALGKTVAINQCTSVVYRVARIMHALHLSR